ncbi:MAG TPA: UDP-N-acetylmuramate dehydrogenase [Bryobacteraceae bacterium]|jgi:UDP-N-acetylmuramate dehydrogenase|nr:UDP-N-acetylmuramate dehydrogenase [Bryobacteraceae bacterium]
MAALPANVQPLAAIPNLSLIPQAPLGRYTRFGIGGPARFFCDTPDADAFAQALRLVRSADLPHVVIGGGTNLIVSDEGFDGVVLRFTGSRIEREGDLLIAEAGAVLQDVVDGSIIFGLKGMESMTGIPGYLGAAIYGNAGAYGQSIQERVERVYFTDGDRTTSFSNVECKFHYRESVFKTHKDWIIVRADLQFVPGDSVELAQRARAIRETRDAKYPPSMKCAGSIFKNLFFANLPGAAKADLPPSMVRDGKVPSAWFLEKVGAKGLRRGGIVVADYHANLIYNEGQGTAAELVSVIAELKQRVQDRFGFQLEEEVQYVGFEYAAAPV